MKNKIGIIGYGTVGKALHVLFKEVLIYDIDGKHNTKEEINQNCQVVFIAVPTPSKEDGSCDTSAVEETVDWLEAPLIVIKSTVAPGTTDNLISKTGKNILFNPEFLREATAAQDLLNENYIIIGGEQKLSQELQKIYENVYQRKIDFCLVTAREAEMIKYMRNAFLSAKVIFMNEMKAICDVLRLNFEKIRDVWVLDPRMGPSHNEVTREGGFAGKCFPKDFLALIKAAEKAGYDPKFLKETWNANLRFRKMA